MSSGIPVSDMSPAVKASAVAMYVAGESKSHISKALQVSRPTVIKILKEAQIDDFIETGKADVLQLIPKALEIVEQSLSSEDESIRLKAAHMILKGVGILSDKVEHSGEVTTVNFITHTPRPNRDAESHVN